MHSVTTAPQYLVWVTTLLHSGGSLPYREQTVPGTATLQNESKCGLMLESIFVILHNLLEFRYG